MSKRREREPHPGGDAENDVSSAEALLFQLASDAEDISAGKPSKRSKTTNSKLAGSAGNGDNDFKETLGGDAPKPTADGSTPSDPTTVVANGKHPAAITPSSALRHCNGFDVVRKGSRGRGRQLMVLPGALGLGSGGGGGGSGGSGATSARLGTLNIARPTRPILYVEFPEGRLKCTGRTVHTKGRFFTLYADKAAKRATRMDCRDVFDSVVFFSKACWVGKKEDNPEEEPLPLPDSLQSLPQEASGSEAAYKTHFGGGNPGDSSKRRSLDGTAGSLPEQSGLGEGEGKEEGEGDGATKPATAARRSSRSTKSTATYVEESDDSEGEDGSSSSSSDDAASDGGGRGAKEEEEKEGEHGDESEPEVVEMFSILDAPTAKRGPVTVGSGKESVAKKTPAKGKKAVASGSNGKTPSSARKRKGGRAVTSPGSSEGDSDEGGGGGGNSGEDSPASDKPVPAEPSRRSRRSSAVSRVKYTQSSGSEEEEEEEEDEDEDEEDF